MITIDGSHGEGGGQILRSSLALSILTQQPVEFVNVRAGRSRPGLQRQHLAAVLAAAEISRAKLTGAELHSQQLSFSPRPVQAGDYHFDIGSAGSTSLVLQTVLPPLMLADGPSRLTLEGGTHNPWAPPFEFLAECFLPVLQRMGPVIRLDLVQPGFAPAGRGRVSATIDPVRSLSPLTLDERGPLQTQEAEAVVARLPVSIAERELSAIGRELGWTAERLRVRELRNSAGPGNIVLIRLGSATVTEVASSIGQKWRPAEEVGADAARQAAGYLAAGVPVGEHLADQLLLPLALAGSGSFVTLPLSGHALTNIDILGRFLPAPITWNDLPTGGVRVQCGAA